MSKNYIWIVEVRLVSDWVPCFNEVEYDRQEARKRAKKRREIGQDVRVRKYVRAGK